MSKHDRDSEFNYPTPRYHRCPGYKRACGVNTRNDLCWFCQKSRDLEKQKHG